MLKSLFRERRRARIVNAILERDLGGEAETLRRLVETAATSFNAPFALLSLIDSDRQWLVAAHGVELTCVPRDDGFCRCALDVSGVLECCDPPGDPRFAQLPVVTGDPHVRYYIGAPLRLSNGIDVGALCVIDLVPRRPASADQRAYLVALARQASLAIESSDDRFVRMSA